MNSTIRATVCCWFALAMSVCVSFAAPFQVTSQPALKNSDNGLLSRVMEFSTDLPTTASFTLTGEGKKWRVESHDATTSHLLPVLGMTFGQNYQVGGLRVEDTNGNKINLSSKFDFSTATRPIQLQNYTPLVSDSSHMEPGLTFFHDNNQTVGVDSDGVVRWQYGQVVWNIHRASNGNLLGFLGSLSTANILREFDITGHTVREWYPTTNPPPANQLSPVAVPVAAQGLHHDVWLMETSGNILTIDRRLKTVEDYPNSATDPNSRGTVELSYDVILELDTAGNIVHQWDTTEILDERRIGFDTYAASSPNQALWSHSNALYHDPTDDSIVVSSRVQDAVFKFDRETGQLKWILGNHENWGPEFQQYLLTPISGPGEEFEWSYHQHNPTLLENGDILLFDNGVYRSSPFDGTTPMTPAESYSRVVEYDIDEVNMTVTQVWSYGKDADEVIFTGLRGGVDLLPQTGNILRTNGVISTINGAIPNPNFGRIQEITRDGEIVFDLQISPGPLGGGAVMPYRSDRFELYDPAHFTVTEIPTPTSGVFALAGIVLLPWFRLRG